MFRETLAQKYAENGTTGTTPKEMIFRLLIENIG